MRSDIFMMTSSGKDCRKGTLQTHRYKDRLEKGLISFYPSETCRRNADISVSVKGSGGK